MDAAKAAQKKIDWTALPTPALAALANMLDVKSVKAAMAMCRTWRRELRDGRLKLRTGTYVVVEELLKWSGLTALDLSGCTIIPKGVLADLGALRRLTTLNLQEYTQPYFEELVHLPALENLDVSDCGFPCMEKLLPLGPKLRSLRVGGCIMGPEDIHALSAFTGLTELDVSDCNDLDDDWLRAISPMIHLVTLWLSNSQLTQADDPVADLSALAPLTALRTLDLGDCLVGDLACLRVFTGLTWLNLMDVKFVEGGDDLRELLPMTALETLDLSHNDDILLSEANVTALCEMKSIKTLELEFVPVPRRFIDRIRSIPALSGVYVNVLEECEEETDYESGTEGDDD